MTVLYFNCLSLDASLIHNVINSPGGTPLRSWCMLVRTTRTFLNVYLRYLEINHTMNVCMILSTSCHDIHEAFSRKIPSPYLILHTCNKCIDEMNV